MTERCRPEMDAGLKGRHKTRRYRWFDGYRNEWTDHQ
jgi:hypothetical protein